MERTAFKQIINEMRPQLNFPVRLVATNGAYNSVECIGALIYHDVQYGALLANAKLYADGQFDAIALHPLSDEEKQCADAVIEALNVAHKKVAQANMHKVDLALQIGELAICSLDLPLRRGQFALEGITEYGRPYATCQLIHDVADGVILGSVRVFEDGAIRIFSPEGLEGLNQEFATRVQAALISAKHKVAGFGVLERDAFSGDD